ncbi:MAG TPA: hypothetical protein VNE62_07715 [Actinomycetota bacterium]|nr:hypothetical protein [Actinomycetota bacterium]
MTPRFKPLVLVCVLALLATGCTTRRPQTEPRESPGRSRITPPPRGKRAESVKPPTTPARDLLGRPGLVLGTNSDTWSSLVKSARTKGVVVLFSTPNGPGSKAKLERGDVITSIADKPSTNSELAVVQLRGKIGESKKVQVTKPDNRKQTITIKLEKAPDKSNLTETYYNKLVQESPNDAVLLYLRAQDTSNKANFDQRLADLDKAINATPAGFVEALSLRADVLWAQSLKRDVNADERTKLRQRAGDDWNVALREDPDNLRTLTSRSMALARLRRNEEAKRDADRAMKVDPTSPYAHYVSSVAETAVGRPAEAAGLARKAIDLAPYTIAYYVLLARLYGTRLARCPDAQKTVDAILPLTPKGPDQDLLNRAVASCKPGGGRSPTPRPE